MKSEFNWIKNRLKYIDNNSLNLKNVVQITNKIDLKRKISNGPVNISNESLSINKNIKNVKLVTKYIDFTDDNSILTKIFNDNPGICNNMGHACFINFNNTAIDSHNSIDTNATHSIAIDSNNVTDINVDLWDSLINCLQV
jgi:hypothetical protein